MRMKNALTILAILLISVQTFAQNIIMSEIPTRDQLPVGDIIRTFQDSEGFIWYCTVRGGLYRDDGYSVKVFRSSLETPDLLESNNITCITEDIERRIWFGTKRGAYVLNKSNYHISAVTDKELKSRVINTINSTSDGSLWIATENTLYRYNLQKQIVGVYALDAGERSARVYSFYEDCNREIWVTQWNGGILKYDRDKDAFISYPWSFNESPTCILKDVSSPYYWVGTWGKGVVRFDPNEKHPERMFVVQDFTKKSGNIEERQINSIAQDSIRNYIWITAMDDLHAYEVTSNHVLQPVEISGALPPGKKIMHDIRSDNLGNLWVSSYRPHSFIVSFQTEGPVLHKMPQIEKLTGLPVTPVKIIYDKGDYWIWHMRFGVYNYQTSNDKVLFHNSEKLLVFLKRSESMDGIYAIKDAFSIVFIHEEENKITDSIICTLSLKQHERIRTLHEDNYRNLWIGTTYNLLKYNLDTKEVENTWENTGIINDITSTEDGCIFVATESNGFLKLSPNGSRQQYHPHKEDNYVRVCITPEQNIWARTDQNRIYFYNTTSDSFSQMTFEYNLTNEIIYEIEGDDQGNLWILTDQKIIIYNPAENSFRLIRCTDPSVHLDNFLTMYRDDRGKIHIGGSGGICVFSSPDEPETITHNSSIGLTDIRVNGVSRNHNNKRIVLQPDERNLELFFSTFDPVNGNKVRFAFRYKGQETYWNHLPAGQNSIYFTELSKGNYNIEIKATSENGSWNEKTINVSIQRLPAWYETWWAYGLYLVTFISIICFIIWKYVDSQNRKKETEMKEQIAQMKYNFFTNISHELRTPLTLIVTPLGTLLRKVTDPAINKQLESINRNAQNLLTLVNQLLDFRKMEMGGENLSLSKGDINVFLTSIYENFQLTVAEKKLQFEYCSDVQSLYIFFDHDKLKKMVNNLLSNAIKFTPETGKIQLSLSEQHEIDRKYVVIRVSDTGKGIPIGELTHIFERFHQVSKEEGDTGSGIGLHLVKEYASMHQGKITVHSEVNKGSVFSIFLPTNLAPENKQTNEINEAEALPLQACNSEKTVLVVEDNNEFRSYMKEELSYHYTVYEATNGVEGEKIAMEKNPDIIITDLIMPEMDGMELCRRIKNNIDISHIPVILLTGNDNIENERRGYKEGADAYIRKPFHWDILLFRIQNLIEQRRQRQQSFEKEVKINPQSVTISSADEKLLKNIIALIEKNMCNSEYSIEDLSSDMHMSRSSLYRKIHSITGLTPTDFVRNIRLKKAAEYLKQGELTIAEVAYKAGFSTPGYFTQAFKKFFGVLPTQYK